MVLRSLSCAAACPQHKYIKTNSKPSSLVYSANQGTSQILNLLRKEVNSVSAPLLPIASPHAQTPDLRTPGRGRAWGRSLLTLTHRDAVHPVQDLMLAFGLPSNSATN